MQSAQFPINSQSFSQMSQSSFVKLRFRWLAVPILTDTTCALFAKKVRVLEGSWSVMFGMSDMRLIGSINSLLHPTTALGFWSLQICVCDRLQLRSVWYESLQRCKVLNFQSIPKVSARCHKAHLWSFVFVDWLCQFSQTPLVPYLQKRCEC